jgi:hypothetical protein
MISETPILVIVGSTTSSALELDTSTGLPAEDEEFATISEEDVGLTSLLLFGTIVELLEAGLSTGGEAGLSSEQAENIPSTETQVPRASNFFVFMSAFLVYSLNPF